MKWKETYKRILIVYKTLVCCKTEKDLILVTFLEYHDNFNFIKCFEYFKFLSEELTFHQITSLIIIAFTICVIALMLWMINNILAKLSIHYFVQSNY